MTRRAVLTVTTAAMALLLAIPAAALANTNEPIAQTGGMSATLPLLGASLKVGVTLDKATGNVTTVALDPTGSFTKDTTRSNDHFVLFTNADGTARVWIKAGGSRLSITARAKSLGDLLGTGTWSGDVFGTGATSTVAYAIGKDGKGNPTVTIGTVSAAAGITVQKASPQIKVPAKPQPFAHVENWSIGFGRVTFTANGFTKTLTIAVWVSKPDGAATLKITLSGQDRQRLQGTLAQLAGPRTWSAHLCDGTAVNVQYHVTADGKVAFDGASGAAFSQKTWGNGLFVRFTGKPAGVAVWLKSMGNGVFALRVMGFSGHCWHDKPNDGSGGSARDHDGWGFGWGDHRHG